MIVTEMVLEVFRDTLDECEGQEDRYVRFPMCRHFEGDFFDNL